MAEIKEPQKVLPFAGLIFTENFPVESALGVFQDLLGTIIKKSEIIPFKHTTYYNKEMGENLLRQWVVFEKLVYPDILVDLKHKSNEIEKDLLNETGGRKINIDPGLISLSNVILASTKNYAHRIYFGKGIYAEVTLIYKDHLFRPLEWTYPDYRETAAIEFFNETRMILKEKMIQKKNNWLNG